MQISSRIWDALGAFAPIALFDSGLADAFVLETYEHGTSPASYDSIYLHGVDPDYAMDGETGFLQAMYDKKLAYAEARTVDRFFAFDPHARLGSFLPSIVGCIAKSILGRQYAIVASMAGELKKTPGFISQIKGFCLGISVPIIKLRFVLNEGGKFFENDEFFESGFASYTEEKIGKDHLGIQGILMQGLNRKWVSRVKKTRSSLPLVL